MRTINSTFQDAIDADVIRWIWLVRLDFDGGTVGWSSAFKPITYGGYTYLAAGPLGEIGTIQEEPGVKSISVSVTLSGVTETIISLMLAEPYLNRPASIYAAVSDENWGFDSNLCKLMFRGTMDSINGVMGQNPSFTVNLKSRLGDWERKRSFRYSDADQQRLYPGDLGFNYIPQLSQKQIIWPRAAFLPDAR